MVIKKMRSEYMKKFKDPKWETYNKCYEELLKYRLTRRLLEHTHNPWFWNGSDSDSDPGAGQTPPNKNQVRAENTEDVREVEWEECEGVRTDRQQKQKILHPEEEEESVSPSAVCGAQREGGGETGVAEEEEEEEQKASSDSKHLPPPQREQDQERDPGAPHPQQTKPSKSSKSTRRAPRVGPAPLRKPGEDNKESRHPFALYGWGEKHADMASKKTHNVGPAASTKEIFESALRAKTRREVEHHIQTRRAERRRTKSDDLDKSRTKPTQSEFNPWLTEYMLCFSGRNR
ncbi:centriole, cilia and spindle-associated protein [Diretmus argenteus]